MPVRMKLLCGLLALALLICILPEMPLAASAAQMDLSEDGLALIKRFEGFSNDGKPYWDYAQWSMGYGSYCSPDMVAYYTANPLTEPQAAELLLTQLQSYIQEVRSFLTRHNKTVTQNQFDALVSFTYNCGGGWTWEETGYFHNAVESAQTNTQFLYAMMLFSTAGGDFILIPRRMAEANLYINGVYNNSAPAPNFKYVFLDGGGGTPIYRINGYDANEKLPPYDVFKSVPYGPDKTGAIVEYVFDGWYTARTGGTKVTALDGSLNDGAVIYAHWKMPDGTPVEIPREETGVNIQITIDHTEVNIRPGPGTYYEFLRKSEPNEKIIIDMLGESRGELWGRFGEEWICLTYTDYSTVLSKVLPRWGTVSKNGIPVYSKVGNSGSQTATKNAGDQVRVTEWEHSGSLMYGKIDEGWICLQNIQWNPGDYDSAVQSVELINPPTKTQYVQKAENLDLTGGQLRVTYSDGMVTTVPMSSGTADGFDNSQIGPGKVTVTYAGQQVQFDIQIVKAVVTFIDFNGTVLGTGEYAYGDAVNIPSDPVRPADSAGNYKFIGWNPAVSNSCTGSVTYKAQYILLGDVDGDGAVSAEDAIHLLWYVYFPQEFEAYGMLDVDKNGVIDANDGIYLLWHIYFPEEYPLAA